MKIITLLITSLLFISGSASAGEITGITWFSGVASVAGESVATPAAGNDNFVGDENTNVLSILQKDYTAIGPVDLEFTVVNSSGTTEYAVIEGPTNSSGIPWTSYHMELGFGVSGSFVKSTADDGLDFDFPDQDSTISIPALPGFFTSASLPTEDDLIFTGGVHSVGISATNYVFHIDVPDGISSFTLRQSPIAAAVPEPGFYALLGLSSLLIGARYRSVAEKT